VDIASVLYNGAGDDTLITSSCRPIEFLCGFCATPSVPAELAIEDLDDQRDSSDWQPPHHAVLVNVSPLVSPTIRGSIAVHGLTTLSL
jgi:hypothetical protein